MIRINLLPVERRRKERTPLPRFFIIIGSVVLSLLLLIWDVHTYLVIKSSKSALVIKNKEITQLKKDVADYPRLQQEETRLTTWKNAVEEIKATRPFFWYQKVDQLWDIMSRENPKVWLTSLDVDTMSASRGSKKELIEAVMKFKCKSAGLEIKTITDFFKSLKTNHEFITDLPILNDGKPPRFKIVEEAGSKELFAGEFSMELKRVKKIVTPMPGQPLRR